MKTILVTGGAGFIGSHTCLVLLEAGIEVFVIDSFVNSNKSSLKEVLKIFSGSFQGKFNKINLYEGDIRDENLLLKIFDEAQREKKPIDGVIHFAGLKSVEESIHKPLKYWDFNVNGTLSLLKVMEENNCKNIVFSSSATIYANSNEKIKEDFYKKSINPYASTKITIEKLLEDYFLSNREWRITNLRYFNPIGAHKSGLIGENPLGKPNNIFPLITLVASEELSNIKIFGNNWPTKDGTGVRDYIHVMDLAEGHLSALNYSIKNKPGILNVNLGTGKGYSVLELIKTFEEVNNVKVPYVFAPRRDGDNAYVVADNHLALSTLDWYPKRDLEDMGKDGWNWQIKNNKRINNKKSF